MFRHAIEKRWGTEVGREVGGAVCGMGGRREGAGPEGRRRGCRRTSAWVVLTVIAVGLSLTACSSSKMHTRPSPSPPVSSAAVPQPTVKTTVADDTGSPTGGAITVRSPEGADGDKNAARRPLSYTASPPRRGPATGVRPGGAAKPEVPEEEKIALDLAFDAADIYQVLDATLYQLFHTPYIADPSLQAKVTFRLKGNYSRAEFINVLSDVLQVSGLALVPGPGRMIKVVRKDQSAGLARGLEPGEPGEALAEVTRMVRLLYLDATTAANNVRPFMSPGAVVVPETAGNTLILTDTPATIDRVVGLLAAMDVDYIREVSWKIYPLKHAKAEQVVEELGKILSAQGLYVRQGAEAGAFQLFPIKSLNAVMAASRLPSVLDHVQRWIPFIDQPGGGGQSVHVYFVENGSAEDLANLIGHIYGIATTSLRQRDESRMKSVVTPSTTTGTSPTPTTSLGSGTSATTLGSRTSGSTPTAPTAIGGKLTDEVSLVADPTTNAVIIRATERDYQEILSVLQKLDIIPRQVLISVIIAEISLSGSVEYGIEWFLQGHWDKYTGQWILDGTRKAPQALGAGSGFTAAVLDGTEFLRGLIYALGKDSEVNILSSPNIMASDHKEAYIEVAEEVPLVTGETTSQELTATTRTIQYRKTGIILKVTPHISSKGLVRLDISQEVSERGERDVELKTTSIVSRRAETSLVVHDGQMIVIGGLMRNRDALSRSGVPGLRDMPVLKYLFGAKSKDNAKSELIILITPKVVRSRAEADMVTEEFYGKVQKLRDLVEKQSP